MLTIPVAVSLVLKMEEKSRSLSCSILLGISPNPGISPAYNIDWKPAHCVEILLKKKLLSKATKNIENHLLHCEGV